MAAFSNVIGFDDAPFAHEHRGDVLLVGAVCARTRLDGVVSTRVRRDGANAARRMIEAISGSRFAPGYSRKSDSSRPTAAYGLSRSR